MEAGNLVLDLSGERFTYFWDCSDLMRDFEDK